MAKFKVREIALLSLPIVAFGAFGWWANSRQTERVERESGPYRTRLISIEEVPLTPFEQWQGFDSKVRILATDDGKPQLPPNVKLSGERALDGQMVLVGETDQGRVEVPLSGEALVDDGISRVKRDSKRLLRVYGPEIDRHGDDDLELRFLIKSSHFKAGTARLKGWVSAREFIESPTKFYILPTGVAHWKQFRNKPTYQGVSAQVDHLVTPSPQSKSSAIDRRVPKLTGAKIVALSPREAGLRAGKGSFYLYANFDCTGLDVNWDSPVVYIDPHLEDDGGRRIAPIEVMWRGLAHGDPNIYINSQFHLPPSLQKRGPVNAKFQVSGYGSWPTPVSVRVPDAPKKVARSRKLKLNGLRLIKSERGYSVQAQVKYTGNLALETEGTAATQWDEVALRQTLAPREAGTDRLLANYSQHLQFADGKTQWKDKYVRSARAQCAPGNSCTVTYPIPAMNRWQPGQSARFQAQIGIEGDGFLDVDLPISKAR